MAAIGLALENARTIATDARHAEELGIDLVAVGEHLFHHGPAPNPFVQLAAAAGATSRIRLASTISLVPLYPAALTAKLAATLDQVSGGRFELGVGAGGEYPGEFRAVGVDPATRFRRLDEAMDVLQALFTGRRVSFRGEFTSFDDLALDPPPVQPGGPPIWMGGRRDGAMRRAARYATTWVPYMVTPDRLHTSLTRVRELSADEGRKADEIRGAVFAYTNVDTDGVRARRIGIQTVSKIYQQDFSKLADRYLVLGTPAQVAGRLREFTENGADIIVVHVAAPAEDRSRILQSLAAEVLPDVRGQ